MPHVEISVYPGRDRETKAELAEKARDFIVETLKVDARAVTVSIRDIPREQWAEHIKKYNDDEMLIKPQY